MLVNVKKILGLPVETKSGQTLGELVDIEVETESQSAINYIVGSPNLIKNLLGNKLVIHRSQVISITADKIIVEDNVIEPSSVLVEAANQEKEEMPEGAVASWDKN